MGGPGDKWGGRATNGGAGRQMGGPGDKWGGRATNGGAGRQMGGPGDKWGGRATNGGGRATNGGAGRQIGGPGRQIGGPEMRSDPNGFRSNSEIDSIVIYRYRMTMEDIDPKLLRTFLYVARERKFSAAARLLGLSPSTVSLRIRTLERRLGARLFDRSARGVTLAPSGSDLLPAAREIVAINDRLLERAASSPVPDSVRPAAIAVSAEPKSPPYRPARIKTGGRS